MDYEINFIFVCYAICNYMYGKLVNSIFLTQF